MVVKRGKVGYRSFTLLSANKFGGCKTKGQVGRYVNKTPEERPEKHFLNSVELKISEVLTVC